MSTRSEVLRLHSEGMMTPAIAACVGCTRQRVQQILKAEGLTPNRRVKPADEEIAALCRDGLTNADISRVLGVSHHLITAARARTGTPARSGVPPVLAPSEIMRMIALAREGVRQVDLAKEFGVSQQIISTHCRRHGIRRESRRGSP